MLNHYETVFIVTPVLSEAQVKEAVELSTANNCLPPWIASLFIVL